MGAGAGVVVTTDDYEISNRNIRGKSLMLPIGKSYMESYTWGINCPMSGYIEARDFRKEISALKKEDIELFDCYGNARNDVEDIKKLDFAGSPVLSTPYDPEGIEFVIGGGYSRTVLKRGSAVPIDYDVFIRIDVDGTAVCKDGSECVVGSHIYCEDLVFHPSDLFVEMYEYCWNNWSEDGFDIFDVEDMYRYVECAPPSFSKRSGLKPARQRRG